MVRYYEPCMNESECPNGDDVTVKSFLGNRSFQKHVWAKVGDKYDMFPRALFNNRYSLICLRCGAACESRWHDRPSDNAKWCEHRAGSVPMDALKQGTEILYRDDGSIFGFFRKGNTTVFGEDGLRVIAVEMKGVKLKWVPGDEEVQSWFNDPELARLYAIKKAKNPTKTFFRMVLETPPLVETEAYQRQVSSPPVKDNEPFFDTAWHPIENGRIWAIKRTVEESK